jgi:glycosyltransferase involved in cell wall biosynthesis
MFSVIIPTFNEECNISRCIESILSQKEDCEIILADGGSIDGTLLAASLYDIRYIILDKPDIALQINQAAKISKNEILIILHADCVLAPNSFKTIKYFFSKYPMSAGGAFTMRLEGKRPSNKILAMGGDLFCRLFKIYFGDRAMFVKQDVFEKIGGFKVFRSCQMLISLIR